MKKKLVVAIIAVALIGVMAGCVEKPEVTPPPEATPTVTPKVTPKVTPTPAPVEAKPQLPVKTSCDMCHKRESTANLEAHVKGGLLVNGKPGCFDYAGKPNLASGCHGRKNATVHTVHPSTVGCIVCHGKIPEIPKKGPGGTTCEECHGYPEPLKPSKGNLVNIHLSRGKDCTVCHVGEISQIHGLK